MAEPELSEEPKITKGRSPAYPFIPLEKAVERTEKIAAAGAGKSPYPPEIYYKLWGYGAQSSGSRQTLAALKHFGLVKYVGRGKERRVVLSDLARKIVMDKVPNSPARKKALQEAALVPPIHADLWEKFGHILPDDVVLTTFLTLERDYNADAAKSLIGEYRDTLMFSGLDQPSSEPENYGEFDENKSHQFAVGDLVNWESGGQIQWKEPWVVKDLRDHEDGETYIKVEGKGDYAGQSGWIPMGEAIVAEGGSDEGKQKFAPPARGPSLESQNQGKRSVNMNSDMKEEKCSLDEGEAILIWPKELSAESVQDLEYWLNGILRKAKRRSNSAAQVATGEDVDD